VAVRRVPAVPQGSVDELDVVLIGGQHGDGNALSVVQIASPEEVTANGDSRLSRGSRSVKWARLDTERVYTTAAGQSLPGRQNRDEYLITAGDRAAVAFSFYCRKGS
jgi:hypothetical protein